MLSDFTFVTHSFPNKENIKIYPISDVHLGAAEHLESAWNAFCTRIEKEKDSYLLLGGDMINNATRSSVSNIFEETMRPREQKKRMVEMLTPLREKILCGVSGNHERRSGRDADDDPMYDIMCKLDLEESYRENMAFVRLRFGNNRTDGARNPTYIICVTHGAGGGALPGSALNRSVRFAQAIDGIDALVLGHNHKPSDAPTFKLKVDSNSNTISTRSFAVVSMSSWLEYGGYAARAMLPPTGYIPQELELCGNKKIIRATNTYLF